MCDAQAILARAKNLGLTLDVEGDRIAIAPARLCPPDLLAEFRQHKPALIALLEAKSANLTPDCTPWLHVARQILAGEFFGADKTTTEALTIGLRGIPHPLCQQALARLRNQRPKSTTP
jgi:hypothetical protein